MAASVDEAFRDFLGWLTPTGGETQAARNHRASIEQCLRTNFRMTRFFQTGSFGNGTSVSVYSDVDRFAEMPTHELKQNSEVTLAQMKRVLDKRFPSTGVRIDSPAVVLPFGDDGRETTEVIPADLIRKYKGYSVYEIPDGDGGWMSSAPEAHKSYVANTDQKYGGRLRPLIRFIKAWKYYNNVPLSSFWLEMYVAWYANQQQAIVYLADVYLFLSRALEKGLPSLKDPVGVVGSIRACKQKDRTAARAHLVIAVYQAKKAWDAERAGKNKEAIGWLNKLYAGLFPAYY